MLFIIKTGRHVLELNNVTVTNTGTADFHASVEVDSAVLHVPHGMSNSGKIHYAFSSK